MNRGEKQKNKIFFVAQSMFFQCCGFNMFSVILNINLASDVFHRREIKNKNKWVNCWLGLRRICEKVWFHLV